MSAASSRSRSRASAHHDHARPAPAGDGGRHRLGDRAGQSSPGSADQTARGARPSASARRKRRPGRVVAPPVARSTAAGRAAAAGGGRRRRGRLAVSDPGVPGRHGQPQHVGEGARVPVGDRPGQPGDLRGQHRLRRDHLLQVRQAAGVRRTSSTRSSSQPSTSCPANRTRTRMPGTRRLGQLGRHQVVERPVEVRQRHVHADARDRRPVRGSPVAALGGGQAPAADLRSAARSVLSQVKSGSSRPKWPYAAVCW